MHCQRVTVVVDDRDELRRAQVTFRTDLCDGDGDVVAAVVGRPLFVGRLGFVRAEDQGQTDRFLLQRRIERSPHGAPQQR